MSNHGNVLGKRKRVKKRAAAKHGISIDDLAWVNGILTFTKTGDRVPDTPEIKKK